jgi:hypothetical protein
MDEKKQIPVTKCVIPVIEVSFLLPSSISINSYLFKSYDATGIRWQIVGYVPYIVLELRFFLFLR